MANKSLTRNTDLFPSVFNDFFKPWNSWFDTNGGGLFSNVLTIPSVNIVENAGDFTISLAAPGMKKDDFNIDVDGNLLTVSAETEEKKQEKGDRYTRKEYNYSSFSRSFTLPEGVHKDKIDAAYTDGVLRLVLPKTEEAKKSVARHIAVK